mmetsp:Transcript_46149/g.85811  ORF Transcript_46149/g.85811 Transcript_46149/m.85811 type:complete len:241 (+) Transcript_46149:109-831(+)
MSFLYSSPMNLMLPSICFLIFMRRNSNSSSFSALSDSVKEAFVFSYSFISFFKSTYMSCLLNSSSHLFRRDRLKLFCLVAFDMHSLSLRKISDICCPHSSALLTGKNTAYNLSESSLGCMILMKTPFLIFRLWSFNSMSPLFVGSGQSFSSARAALTHSSGDSNGPTTSESFVSTSLLHLYTILWLLPPPPSVGASPSSVGGSSSLSMIWINLALFAVWESFIHRSAYMSPNDGSNMAFS